MRFFFSVENFVYFFTKTSLTTNLFLLNVFKFLSHQVFRKVDKNCIKFQKPEIFGIFVNFGLNLMHFSKTKCLYLFKKASRQQIVSLLNVCEFLTNQVFRERHKNCIKNFKNQNFQVVIWTFKWFCQIRSEFDAFFLQKLLLYLQRSLSGNKFFPFWTSLTF